MAAADLLPAQADLLLELLDLTVAVLFLVALLFTTPHIALHQLNRCDQRLGNAEVGIFLEVVERDLLLLFICITLRLYS